MSHLKPHTPHTQLPSKSSRRILTAGAAALLAALATDTPAQGQIVVTGSTTYTQNFDSLGTTTIPWVDNTTIPGWFVGMNANATADGNLTISDGTNSALTGLLNLGAASAADRALGSKATGTGGFANIAFGVLFQNTSGRTLDITNISFAGELWRSNDTAGGLAEQWVTFTKTSATTFNDVEPGASAPTANVGTFTAAPAALNWNSPTTANTPVATAKDGNLTPDNRTLLSADPNLLLKAGEFFMFRWVDTNLGGSDGHQGIDDFSISFTAIPRLVYNLAHTVGGLPNSGVLEVSANQYWLDGATGAGFANGNEIAFSQDGSATIQVPADVTPITTTVSANKATYTIGGAGKIAGSLVKTGAGTVIFGTGNSFSSTSIGGGILEMNVAGALGTGLVTLNGTGGTLRIHDNGAGSNGTLAFGNNIAVSASGTIDLDRLPGGASSGNTVALGTLAIGAQTLTVNGANGYAARFNGAVTLTGAATISTNTDVLLQGTISGSFGITKTGVGRLAINGTTNTYTGATIVNAGSIGGTGITGGPLSINSGATLAPGNGPGIFTSKGSLVLAAGSTFSLELGHGAGLSPVAGTDYDQMKVGTGTGATSTGTLTLNGGALALTIGTGIKLDDMFFVILNDGADAITGTFNGLAQGAQFSVSGQLFRISYTADVFTISETGGNDVALIAVPEPGSVMLFFAGAATLLRRRRR